MLRTIATATLFAALSASAAGAACPAPFAADRTFYKGISPSDGPLEVWCRIQSTPGEYEVDAFFADTNVHRKKKFTFLGQGRELGPDVFRDFIQSMIPYKDGKAVDDDGMAFSRVLQNVVQGSASATPGKVSYQLSVPPESIPGRTAMLWETFAIRMKPVNVAGVPFALTIKFQPSPGRLLYETMYGMPGLVVGGWKERLNLGSYFKKSCSSMIPVCHDLPEIVPIHFAMAVEKVILQADGADLSNAAYQILRKIDADTPGTKVGTDPNSFDPVRGTAKREITDLPFAVTFEAKAENGKPRTSQIVVVWEQRQGQNMSYAERLSAKFSELVNDMIRGMGARAAQ